METGYWIHQGTHKFPLDTDKPIQPGEALDADKFSATIPDVLADEALNFKDPVILKEDGVEILRGTLETIELDADQQLVLVEGYDHWNQVWERSTRIEDFKSVDVADIVRRGLGLRYSILEPFDDKLLVDTLTQTEVVNGRLRLKRDANGNFPTTGTMEAISKNRKLDGDISAVTLSATDRVGAESEEVFEDLDDNTASDEAQQTAHYDTVLEQIRLPSDPVDKVFPFDDYSQTDEVTGAAIIKDGALTLDGDLLDEDFEDGDASDWTTTREEWQAAARVKEDLTTTSGIGRNETFETGSERYLLQALGGDGWKGWTLNTADDKWDANSTIETGLAGIEAAPDSFVTWHDGATLYGIIIKNGKDSRTPTTLTGVRWTGTTWTADAEATDGITTPTTHALDAARFDRDNAEHLIAAYRSGYRWESDFSEYATGSSPSDWTAQHNDAWTVEEDAGATGGKLLEATEPNTLGPSLHVYTQDDLNGKGDGEMLVRFRIKGGTSAASYILACRHSKAGGISTAYWLYYTAGGSPEIQLYQNIGTTGIIDNASMTLSESTWYFARLRADGTALKAKVWEASQAEPAAWTLEGTDANGASGNWGLARGESGSLIELDFDTFEFEDLAPTIKFTAWRRGATAWASDATFGTGLADISPAFGTALTPYLSQTSIVDTQLQDHILLLAYDAATTWTHTAFEWDEATDTWSTNTDRWGSVDQEPHVSLAAFTYRGSRYAVATYDNGSETWSGYAVATAPLLDAVGTGHGSYSAILSGRANAKKTFNGTVLGSIHFDIYHYSGREALLDIGPSTFQLKVTTTGSVQYRKNDGTYAALPTPTTIAGDTWHDLDLRWDTTDADAANWTCEVLVNGASKGEISYYQSTNRVISEATTGWTAGSATDALTHRAAFDDVLVFVGHTSGALSGDWISKTFTDPNVLHGIQITPTETKPAGSTVTWFLSRNDGTTWTELTPSEVDALITLPKTSATYKLKAALSAPSIPEAPSVSTLTVSRHYKYLTGTKNWETTSLGASFKPQKMQVDIIDADGAVAKSVPADTSIIIEVSPDGFGTTQAISDGGEATFDPAVIGAADWRVRFKPSTTNAHETPTINSFLVTATPAGSGQSVTYYVSRDDKNTWHELTPGVRFDGFGAGETVKDDLYWKTVFTNSDATSSPETDELSATVETVSNMTGIEEGTINDYGKVSMSSRVEYYGDLLQRIVDLTGLPVKRTFDAATGKIQVDWNTPDDAGTVLEVDSDELEGLKWRRSVTGQANRIIYSGG